MTTYKFFLLTLFFLPGLLMANGGVAREFEKTIAKEFPLNTNGTLNLSSRYGQVNVTSWDREEVKITVKILVDADDQKEADEAFERVQTYFTNSGRSSVTASVTLEPIKTVTGWLFKSINTNYRANNIRVNWEVKMPATADLISETKYCNLSLPDRSGKNELTIQHGNLNAGHLTGRSLIGLSYGNGRTGDLGTGSELNLRYGKFNARNLGDFRYDGRYSHFRAEEAGVVELDIGYDDVTLTKAVEVEVDGSYNDVILGEVARLDIDGNYSDFEIGRVSEVLKVDSRYGDLEVDEIAAGFREISIDVGYLDVELTIAPDAGYRIDLSARYGDIDFARDDELSDRKRQKESYTRSLSGSVRGKGQGVVTISTSYGDIEID